MPSRKAAASTRAGGARPRVQVAGAVGLVAGHHDDVGRQVDIQAAVQLDIGVQGAHLQRAFLQELRNAQALGAGEREVQLVGDAALEQVEVLGQADAGHDHVQALDLARIDLHERAGQKIRLLLVVPFEDHPVAADDQALQGFDQAVGPQHGAVRQMRHRQHAPLFFLAPGVPSARIAIRLVHLVSLCSVRASIEKEQRGYNQPKVPTFNLRLMNPTRAS
jgi:hypothetical protein